MDIITEEYFFGHGIPEGRFGEIPTRYGVKGEDTISPVELRRILGESGIEPEFEDFAFVDLNLKGKGRLGLERIIPGFCREKDEEKRMSPLLFNEKIDYGKRFPFANRLHLCVSNNLFVEEGEIVNEGIYDLLNRPRTVFFINEIVDNVDIGPFSRDIEEIVGVVGYEFDFPFLRTSFYGYTDRRLLGDFGIEDFEVGDAFLLRYQRERNRFSLTSSKFDYSEYVGSFLSYEHLETIQDLIKQIGESKDETSGSNMELMRRWMEYWRKLEDLKNLDLEPFVSDLERQVDEDLNHVVLETPKLFYLYPTIVPMIEFDGEKRVEDEEGNIGVRYHNIGPRDDLSWEGSNVLHTEEKLKAMGFETDQRDSGVLLVQGYKPKIVDPRVRELRDEINDRGRVDYFGYYHKWIDVLQDQIRVMLA